MLDSCFPGCDSLRRGERRNDKGGTVNRMGNELPILRAGFPPSRVTRK